MARHHQFSTSQEITQYLNLNKLSEIIQYNFSEFIVSMAAIHWKEKAALPIVIAQHPTG